MTNSSRRILLAALGLASLNSPALGEPEKVGVAAAVNPDATGQPPNEPLRELLVGHDVIRNERIKTASIGQAQLLFTDQSTLTVARRRRVPPEHSDVPAPDLATGPGSPAQESPRGF